MAKKYLDAAVGHEKRRLPNDAVGYRELLNWIKQSRAPVQVICEPSGGYERGLIQALMNSGVKVSLVPANRVRQFARAAGVLAKTDEIDAKVLCSFGAALKPVTLIYRSAGNRSSYGNWRASAGAFWPGAGDGAKPRCAPGSMLSVCKF